MTAWRVGWLIAAGALVVAGTVAAAAGSPANVVVLSASFAVVGTVLVLLIRWPHARGVTRVIRHRLHSMPRPSERQMDAVVRALASSYPGFPPSEPHPEVYPATDEELCRAWSTSFRALQSCPSRWSFLRIVEEREGLLDELERRNPAAFTAWLASGATASDNPLPYLSLAYIDPTVINWDELIDGQEQ